MAIALLIVFQASVSGLIPLYTLGVFIAFTLSQSRHVHALVDGAASPAGVRGLPINGLGAGDHRRRDGGGGRRATSSTGRGW